MNFLKISTILVFPRQSIHPCKVYIHMDFKQWMGDRPLPQVGSHEESLFQQGTLYHGTSIEFDDFDLSHAGKRDYGDMGIGIYLSPKITLARAYAYESARDSGRKPIVLTVRHNLKNVANLTDEELLKKIYQTTGVSFPPKKIVVGRHQTRPREDSVSISNYLTQLGYDGARVGSEVVAYDPTKLKIVRVVLAEDI